MNISVKHREKHRSRLAAACGAAALLFSVGARAGDDAAALRQVTGAAARVVWIQDQGNHTDVYARSNRFKLLGFDTEDGRGEREIGPFAAILTRPLITPRGDRVVFSLNHAGQVCVVNFDGTGLRRVTNGRAVAVWQDPTNGREWVYLHSSTTPRATSFDPIWRVALDPPEVREMIWDKTTVNAREHGNFQVSADGTRAAGLFPWPLAALVSLPNGAFLQTKDGCWTSLSPDNSYRWWHFDGAHRNVVMFEPGREEGRKVNINSAPGIDGFEVYHPRWTTHPRFLVMTGPYKAGGGKLNFGGPGVEIYLGRFSSDFSEVAAWARVTHNDRADFMPDAWVKDAGQFPNEAPKNSPLSSAGQSRREARRVTLRGKLLETSRVPTPESIAPYRRALVVSTYEVEQILAGELTEKKILVADWGILDSKVVTGRGVTIGKSYELTLERFNAHPELESQRLVQDQAEFDLTLYVTVDAVKQRAQSGEAMKMKP